MVTGVQTCALPIYDLFVVCTELREIELLASLDVGNQELAGAIRFLEVDGDSQVDRGIFDQCRFAVDDVETLCACREDGSYPKR